MSKNTNNDYVMDLRGKARRITKQSQATLKVLANKRDLGANAEYVAKEMGIDTKTAAKELHTLYIENFATRYAESWGGGYLYVARPWVLLLNKRLIQ